MIIYFASPHVTDNGEAVPGGWLLTRSTSYIPSNKVNTKTNAIGIDAKGTSDYAKSRKQSVLDFASFLVEHGAGHNANLNHSGGGGDTPRCHQNCTNAAIMGGGNWVDKGLNGHIVDFGKNINDIKTNSHIYFNNDKYVEIMKEYFGNNNAKNNYK